MRISRAERAVFTGPSALATNPSHRADLLVYLTDMVRPYGLALRTDLPDAGYSYGEMAEDLIRVAVRPDQPVDVVVLAFSIPDVRPGRATAVYLSHVCPGNPLAFALCDQGNAGPFAGLRLVREYLRTGTHGRGVLVVAEQSTVHYEPVRPVALPARHAAVALLLETGPGPAAVEHLRQHAAVDPADVAARLADELAELTQGQERVTLILGNGLASVDLDAVASVRRAPEGQPDTGVWWELAGALADGPVVVAEYEPSLRYLCLASIGLATEG